MADEQGEQTGATPPENAGQEPAPTDEAPGEPAPEPEPAPQAEPEPQDVPPGEAPVQPALEPEPAANRAQQAQPASLPGPRITQLVPNRVPAAGGTPLRILGSGLRPPDKVSVAGVELTSFHVVSDGEIDVTTPAGSPGRVDVEVVVDGSSSSGPPDENRLLYIAAPIVHAAEVKRTGLVELQGDNLSPSRGVLFNGIAASSVRERNGVLVATPPPGPTGTVALTAVTDGGTSDPFTVSLPTGWTRTFVFWMAVTYLGMLLALVLTHQINDGFRTGLPDPFGPLPLSIPWFGALGAVALSLSGVAYHRTDWDSSFLLWHAMRPFMGAVFGSVAYFIIAGGVIASGGNPNNNPANPVTLATPTPSISASPTASTTISTTTTSTSVTATSSGAALRTSTATTTATTTTPTTTTTTATSSSSTSTGGGGGTGGGGVKDLFYIVVAFVVGYREETFRKLIERVGDVILGPDSSGGGGGGGGTSGGGSSGTRGTTTSTSATGSSAAGTSAGPAAG